MTQRSVHEQDRPHWLEIEDIPETHECDGGDRMAKAIEANLQRALGEEAWQWLKEETMKIECLVMFRAEEKWIRTEKLKDLDVARRVERALHDAGMVARVMLIKTSEEIYLH